MNIQSNGNLPGHDRTIFSTNCFPTYLKEIVDDEQVEISSITYPVAPVMKIDFLL